MPFTNGVKCSTVKALLGLLPHWVEPHTGAVVLLAQVERCKAAAAKKVMQASSTAAKPAAELKRTEGYNVAYAGNIAYDTTREELMELFK